MTQKGVTQDGGAAFLIVRATSNAPHLATGTTPTPTRGMILPIVTDADLYHPEAVKELRSYVTNDHGAGQQCTYDEHGNLITHGPGAGTPDRVHYFPAWGVFGYIGIGVNWGRDGGHIGHDVSPFDLAYSLDGDTHGANVDKYLKVRPPNNGNDCPKNP